MERDPPLSLLTTCWLRVCQTQGPWGVMELPCGRSLGPELPHEKLIATHFHWILILKIKKLKQKFNKLKDLEFGVSFYKGYLASQGCWQV